MSFSIDQLAEETFKINENLGMQFSLGNYEGFEELRQTSTEEIEKEIIPQDEIPSGPGISFWISKCPGTFCVKGKVTSHLEEFSKQDKKDDQVFFFKTIDKKSAEFVGKQFLNRRFPIEEDLLCNLSDPGFSWWLNESANGFEIFFQSHGIYRARDYVRLGLIGDSSIAHRRMNESLELLNSLFSIKEFSSTYRQFSIKVEEPNTPEFIQFKNIFLKGESNFENLVLDNPLVQPEYIGFLKETALLRNFWLKIEEALK